jgi:uncharacterized protein (DUF1800 family)
MLCVALPVFRGPFKAAQAERLLWRAGFGPKKGDPGRLAKLGLTGAVLSLTRPGESKLVGPAPHDDRGNPLTPGDAWGHDHLWWLDRMVRTTTPLIERMTLIWHDWFATSNDSVGSVKLMLDQNNLFRTNALGSFSDLLVAVTKDPAMLIFLNGLHSTAQAPNENYGRELMELFTLGADRPGGYTEQDVRDQARALTGWRADWSDSVGDFVNFRFDKRRHDNGTKTIFGQAGAFDWQDSCKLVLKHPNHASFFVNKLWSYFVPTAADSATQSALAKLYVDGNYAVGPVVEAILQHPSLYMGPPMVKPPVVYTAGILRKLGRGIDTESWVWLCSEAGQLLFHPPNVAGWDESRWLDTARFRGRWNIANYALMTSSLDPEKHHKLPSDAVKLYTAAVGASTVSPETRKLLLSFVRTALADAGEDWEKKAYPPMIVNALRQLVALSPDQQTS